MKGVAKSLRLLPIAVAIAAALSAAGAQGALVKIGPLILRADGGFTPTALPKHKFVPIDFQGHAEIERKDGGVPPVLERAVIDFDRDGRLNTSGLPQCPPERVAGATPGEARRLCRGAIVGTGHVDGLIAVPGLSTTRASSLLTIFNGPREEGNPTVVLHAQLTSPATQTFAIVVPIERKLGAYGYRATLDMPPIAGGWGALTHVDAKIGRRYASAGVKRSYVSARCGDGILETHGTFTFTDGTVIDGTVGKFCKIRQP
jgi:hypothetical protein